MSEHQAKYGKNTVEYTKPAPDKTIEQELYSALKAIDTGVRLSKAAKIPVNLDNLLIATAYAIKLYEDNLNSK